MNKILPNLGLNNGVPESAMTWPEVLALIVENQRKGGRTLTRKTQTQMY